MEKYSESCMGSFESERPVQQTLVASGTVCFPGYWMKCGGRRWVFLVARIDFAVTRQAKGDGPNVQ